MDFIIDNEGNERKCGTIPNPVGFSTRLKAFDDMVPMLTKDQIMSVASDSNRVRRRVLFGADWTLNQLNFGSCGGHMEAGIYQKARYLRGIQDGLKFSGAYNYSKCNGGSDNGSLLADEEKSGTIYGHAPATLVTANMIYPHLQPQGVDAEAAKHLSEEPYAIHTLEELQSALALGIICGVAVMVGSSFTRISSDGICGVDSGAGNHAVHVDDISIVNGQLVYDLHNSWGNTFGINGRAWLIDNHFKQTIGQHQFYAVMTTKEINEKFPSLIS